MLRRCDLLTGEYVDSLLDGYAERLRGTKQEWKDSYMSSFVAYAESRVPKAPIPDIRRELDGIMSSSLPPESKGRRSLFLFGIPVVAAYMTRVRGKSAEEAESAIRGVLSRCLNDELGRSRATETYTKSCRYVCAALRDDRPILHDWEEKYSEIWEKLNVRKPPRDEGAEMASQRFFSALVGEERSAPGNLQVVHES